MKPRRWQRSLSMWVREARNDKYSATDEEFEHWLNGKEKRHAWGVLMADDELSDRDD
jgi:hypothetical protein